jgi:hypothetical protein
LWNDIQVAHFASAASWGYLVSPFVFAGSQFLREEIEAWREDGQIWRRLVVTRPETVVANTRQQTVFVDADGLVRRIDYAVDTLGGAAVVQYASRYREFDGIKVPTRRRVYLRKPDGSLARQAPTFGFDIRELHYLGDAPEDSHHIIRGGPDDPH